MFKKTHGYSMGSLEADNWGVLGRGKHKATILDRNKYWLLNRSSLF